VMLTEAAIKIKAKQSGLVRMASPFAFINKPLRFH
jgi:hypothetical protein